MFLIFGIRIYVAYWNTDLCLITADRKTRLPGMALQIICGERVRDGIVESLAGQLQEGYYVTNPSPPRNKIIQMYKNMLSNMY